MLAARDTVRAPVPGSSERGPTRGPRCAGGVVAEPWDEHAWRSQSRRDTIVEGAFRDLATTSASASEKSFLGAVAPSRRARFAILRGASWEPELNPLEDIQIWSLESPVRRPQGGFAARPDELRKSLRRGAGDRLGTSSATPWRKSSRTQWRACRGPHPGPLGRLRSYPAWSRPGGRSGGLAEAVDVASRALIERRTSPLIPPVPAPSGGSFRVCLGVSSVRCGALIEWRASALRRPASGASWGSSWGVSWAYLGDVWWGGVGVCRGCHRGVAGGRAGCRGRRLARVLGSRSEPSMGSSWWRPSGPLEASRRRRARPGERSHRTLRQPVSEGLGECSLGPALGVT